MKITKIVINNYRAFYSEGGKKEFNHTLTLEKGQNVLIYGENGSGKSSFYKALSDLFRSSIVEECSLIQNVFSKNEELEEQPFVRATFSSAEQADQTFCFSADPSQTNTAAELPRSIAMSRSFMTYRDLLRVHFVKDLEVNLFEFLFDGDGLLADIPNPSSSVPETKLKMNELYVKVKEDPDDVNIKDFATGVNQILTDLKDTLNQLLLYFDKSLTVTFSSLTEASVKAGKPVIKLNVTYFGVNLNEEDEQYHHFLNEARLSALAICIFLAAHLSVPLPEYKILFLDDIFTGLDMSNRIPLLDILTDPVIKGTASKTFVDHQVFLTTYDRQWFGLAKNHLDSSRWVYQEMFIDHHSKPFDQPVWKTSKDDLEKAQDFFRTKEYPSCANYQRKICENLIKKFLPENKKYDALYNGDIAPVNTLGTLVDRLRKYLGEVGISFTPFEKLQNCVRVVMNPLSHDDLESQVYKRELELVFSLIEELKKLKNTILLKSGSRIVLRKINQATGKERKYTSELTNPIRRIEYGTLSKILPFDILPLNYKEDTEFKRLNYEGAFNKIYEIFCTNLQIPQATDPYAEFTLENGTPLNQIIATP